MAHRIIIMRDKEEQQSGGAMPFPGHREALEAAAAQISTVGHRFFRAVKTMMVRNMELPHDVREMGESQMMVLHSLSKGRQRTSDLAKRFNVTNPTMTRIVDALVDRGYVNRRPQVDDRRCIFLEI